MSVANLETSAALSLLNATAVRERAHRMLAIGLDDELPNFRHDMGLVRALRQAVKLGLRLHFHY